MQLTTALAATGSPASMRRSKSSLGKAAAHLPSSPLSTASNNLIPISYNELEVTDQLQQGAESAPPTSSHQIGLDDFELIKVSVGRGC